MQKQYISRTLAILLIFSSVLAFNVLKSSSPIRAASPGDWTTYLNNPGHTGFNGAEAAINANTAGSLKQLWRISAGSILSTQPVVAKGLIYWGSWDGIEHATKLTAHRHGQRNLVLVRPIVLIPTGLQVKVS